MTTIGTGPILTIGSDLLATGKSRKNGIFATVHRTGAEIRAPVELTLSEEFIHMRHGVVELHRS